MARRKKTQPLTDPIVRQRVPQPAGGARPASLVERAGLKGMRIGGAQVSELHANFIVNTGDATARDVKDLIELVQAKV